MQYSHREHHLRNHSQHNQFPTDRFPVITQDPANKNKKEHAQQAAKQVLSSGVHVGWLQK